MTRKLVLIVPLLTVLGLAYCYWPLAIPQKLDEVPGYLSARYGGWANALARRAAAGELTSQDRDCVAFSYFMLHPELRLALCEFKQQIPQTALYSKRVYLSERGLREFRRQTGLNVPDHFHVYLDKGSAERFDSQLLAELLLNDNSIHFMNKARDMPLESFPVLLDRYAAWFDVQGFERSDFCLDNAAVLALYGLHDAYRVDFLHLGKRTQVRSTIPHGCRSRNEILKRMRNVPVTREEIINNPTRHFYYYGHKVVSFDTLRQLKELQGREKDLHDLSLMAALESGDLQAPEPERRPRSLEAVPVMLKARYPSWGTALWRRAKEGRLSEEDRDIVALMYCMLNYRARVVIQDREPAGAVYGKSFQINARAQSELERQTGIPIPASGSLWVLRRGYGYDRERSLRLAQGLLNRNSLHWLEQRSEEEMPQLVRALEQLDKWLCSAGYNKEDLCIDDAGVLAAYGLRDADELPLMHLDPRLQLDRTRPSACRSHNALQRDKLGQDPVLSTVTDPRQHFYAYGFKFSSLRCLKAFKEKRGTWHDQQDLALLAALPDMPEDSLALPHNGM